jgi:hypothetical protein
VQGQGARRRAIPGSHVLQLVQIQKPAVNAYQSAKSLDQSRFQKFQVADFAMVVPILLRCGTQEFLRLRCR